MSVPVWCADLAAGFWAAAGDPPPYPRDLRSAVALSLPLDVVEVPRLTVAGVRGWLEARAIVLPLDEPDRPLRACLVAWRGYGFAFLDAGDPPAEGRFSLAHELAHFLRDYWRPRRTAARRLGPAVLEVLDGRRPPTADERVRAVLRNAAVGPFAHLLGRDDAGRPLSPAEREAEAAADRLPQQVLQGRPVRSPPLPSVAPCPGRPGPAPGREPGGCTRSQSKPCRAAARSNPSMTGRTTGSSGPPRRPPDGARSHASTAIPPRCWPG